MSNRREPESHYQESRFALYYIFRHEKKWRLEDMEAVTGVPYSTLKKYMLGNMACPVEVIVKIYRHTRHPQLKRLLETDRDELVARSDCRLELLGTVHEEFCDDFQKIVDLMRACEKALEDGNVSAQEKRDIEDLTEIAVAAVRNSSRKALLDGRRPARVRAVQ